MQLSVRVVLNSCLFVALVLLAGCGGGAGSNSVPISVTANSLAAPLSATSNAADACNKNVEADQANCSSHRIYVANSGLFGGPSSVTVYSESANGNVAPIASISGPNTGLNVARSIAVDHLGNIYVANSNSHSSVTVYAANASGNATPIRTISGADTGLDDPSGIALDVHDNIYVANYNGYEFSNVRFGGVTVYPAGANGDVPPVRTIAGLNTLMHGPTGLTVDPAGNLYVVNSHTILAVFQPGADGDATPVRTVTDVGAFASGIALGASGNIDIGNLCCDNDVLVFPTLAAGSTTPIATISGPNTELSGPGGVALDSKGVLYVSNLSQTSSTPGAGSVTVYAPGANGNVTPIRTITGSATGLNAPYAIAVR